MYTLKNIELPEKAMKLTLGFSPCPNDTFIFDAIVNGKIDTGGLSFDYVISDVEDLNRQALNGLLDITKISYNAYAWINDNYALLHAGSALGNNCGPLLIALPGCCNCFDEEEGVDVIKKREKLLPLLENLTIAIPGKLTTANFLFHIAFPSQVKTEEMLFSEIEEAVLKQKVHAGIIIHENRFTYRDRGLIKLIDLGEYWEMMSGLPIPLGGIAIKRQLSPEIQRKVDAVLKASVGFAFQHPESSIDFVKTHAQKMADEVIKKHIALYVNDYTLDIGEKGKRAVDKLFQIAYQHRLIPRFSKALYVD